MRNVLAEALPHPNCGVDIRGVVNAGAFPYPWIQQADFMVGCQDSASGTGRKQRDVFKRPPLLAPNRAIVNLRNGT